MKQAKQVTIVNVDKLTAPETLGYLEIPDTLSRTEERDRIRARVCDTWLLPNGVLCCKNVLVIVNNNGVLTFARAAYARATERAVEEIYVQYADESRATALADSKFARTASVIRVSNVRKFRPAAEILPATAEEMIHNMA